MTTCRRCIRDAVVIVDYTLPLCGPCYGLWAMELEDKKAAAYLDSVRKIKRTRKAA